MVRAVNTGHDESKRDQVAAAIVNYATVSYTSHRSGDATRMEFHQDEWPIFIELPGFTRAWTALNLGDSDLRSLQEAILEGPNRHPVVSAAGGLRKIRFARPGEVRRQEILLPGLLRLLLGEWRGGTGHGIWQGRTG